MPKLTKAEWDAVRAITAERLAGGTDDLRDALGCDDKTAAAMMRCLERVHEKLNA